MKEKARTSSVNATSWQKLSVETRSRTQVRDITEDVAQLVQRAGIDTGVCHLYVPHTTAGILVNESDDPDVARDIGEALDRLIPRTADYKHFEGNADSHIKASVVGTSETIPIESGKLALGRWQGVFFCEFDGPRRRTVKIRVSGD